ncbi:uncharacterized protein F5147DRAFT_778801 [Suillus discolor]|uniref:F-box domain-containing protein n=1 Tax=Suillus discolor TaxID=1912936 RepID=A0A9P7EY56_9AGAM|nr:uncharacterized protein F5147DRAFT_778801 [Suillus discolor]KAG2095106.1 hypothetical protein F5147DRAFT_778801 [Suillus discolor]
MHPRQITIRRTGIETTILHKPHPVMGIFQSQPCAKILLGIGNTDSLASLDCLSSLHSLERKAVDHFLDGCEQPTHKRRMDCLSLLHSLEEHIPLKRKAVDHFLDGCERPTHKRRTPAFWNGKNRSSQDPIHSDLRQAQTLSFVCDFSKSSIPKKCTLVRTYAIEDLSVQEEGPLGCFSRTHEGLEQIASITKPSVRAEKQVSENFLEQDKGRAKRKASDVPSGSSPPMPKRCSWSCLSVIADQIGLLVTEVLTVQPPSSCWPFPNELVLKILEDMPTQDLRVVAQVSCLSRELAAPLYLHSVGLSFDDTSLCISTQACFTLLMYRRSTLFRVPKYLQCNLLDADDRHLQALSSFIELLGSNSSLFVSIVKDGEMLGDFAPLFQSIRDSGCRSLRFSDQWGSHLAYPPPTLPDFIAALDPAITNNFHIFHVNSPIFFSRSMVALTLSSLRGSSLTNLSLTHTSLSILQWTVLMHDIHFPRLRFLSIDIECPATTLVEFLTWHEVHQLWLYSMRPEIVSLDGMDLMQNVTTPRIPIHSLHSLAGPHWYISSLLDKVRLPLRIQNLDLELDRHFLTSTPNYLLAIINITQQFILIDHLRLSFYDRSLISQSFDVSLDEYRTIPVKNLTIFLPHWYKYSDRHPLVSCSPWLQAFQHVEKFFLRPGDVTASERQELEAAYRRPENPYCLDIGHFV